MPHYHGARHTSWAMNKLIYKEEYNRDYISHNKPQNIMFLIAWGREETKLSTPTLRVSALNPLPLDQYTSLARNATSELKEYQLSVVKNNGSFNERQERGGKQQFK